MFIRHDYTPVVNNRLTQIGPLFRPGTKNTLAVFACECGKYIVCQVGNVVSGASSSCGCLQRELQSARATKHGKRHTKVYNVWVHIRDRCRNPNNSDYAYYGERGITVDSAWDDFTAFYNDMGDPPSPAHSIDRRDNNKGYGPGNCRWVLQVTQNRNKRNSRMLTAFGVTRCLSEWAEVTKLPSYLIRRRISKGWSVEQTLNTPK